MNKRRGIWTLVMLALALTVARAQDQASSGQSVPDQTAPTPDAADRSAQGNSAQGNSQPQQQALPPQSTTPSTMPSYGENLPSIEENPPISGLDQPGLEPHGAPLSYIQPGATISESADSNVGNTTGGGAVQSITRGLGSVELQRLWSHYDLAAQYIGGAAYYNNNNIGWKLLQQMDLDQKITWKRGQFSLRDSFGYLPEGNFGAAYGSLGSQGIASLGNTSFGSFWGGAGLGTFGLVSRITNVSVADVSESLTPKSTVTAAGGYAVTHFYGTTPDPITAQPISLLDNRQVSAQVGYNRLISSRTQVALIYGYQGFDFPSFDESFHSHVFLGMYGHRITGRMDFLIGAGPQITDITLFGSIPDQRIGVAGRMRLRYQLPRTSFDLSYERFNTSGSGFFAGAQTDTAVLSAQHNLTRVWNVFTDLGYSRNSRLLPLDNTQLATCNPAGVFNLNPKLPTCPGVNANTYSYGFVGVGAHRAFGRNFHGFVSYEFNRLAFDNSYCAGLSVCSRIGNRSVGTVGLDWTPRPIRID
jgi:hypothetical protein